MQTIDSQYATKKPAIQPAAQPGPGTLADLDAPAQSGGHLWILVLAVIVLALAGIVWKVKQAQAAALAATTRRADPSIPITPGTVVRTNVPIYLDGLGTV